MRGGHVLVSHEELAQFPVIIEALGYELASKHQTEAGIIKKEDRLTKTAIHDRDYQWLTESDIGIFEISNPSLGVGAEIADMVHLGKPVLCLYKEGLEAQVSAYVLGKKGSQYVQSRFECYAYSSITNAKDRIRTFVDSL